MPQGAGQITVYPANRLEDLAVLLDQVLRLSPGAALSSHTVIVESKGMQHWVSMALAESRGVCMNTQFPMPGVFIWQLVRKVLGVERVPLESPYQREALAWRIDRLLASEAIVADPRFAEPTRYWRKALPGAEVEADPLKRYQLAAKQADLFEQYLLFRPDWIEAWDAGETPDALPPNWQGALWQALVAEEPDHPVRLQREAAAALGSHREKLPPQVCLFAINTLPPSTLGFFDRLARHVQVHLFHLNPCVEYWGNLQSEKQLAAQRAEQARRWLAQPEPDAVADAPDHDAEVGNPLLANLGSQGKEFFAALQGLDTFEIAAFELDEATRPGTDSGPTVLEKVQSDILRLRDARPADPAQPVSPEVDDSITFSASHSALRELQALHDWLLHRFNEDPTLTPRDVLVTCPQVEDYAPYIGAVFDTGFGAGAVGVDEPRLPVAVTDRAPRDAEPLISSFLELLQLPDSRFQVSKVLDLLRLPTVQQRFGFNDDELLTLEWWLSEACIHWGLDGEHKARVTGADSASELFSWQWGLRRMLLGFARGDQAELVDHQWLLPHVEGSDALLLGRLMQLLERLQQHAQALSRRRTPKEWGDYLRALRDDFFAATQDSRETEAGEELDKAIGQLLSWTDRVGYRAPLTLDVVRFYLNHHLGLPDGGNRFMTGQITFCSLEPMRSAPFRVIAILGLNDGAYPRQQVPFGFDLMASTPRRAGDRSRRGDDRYLFLEALICTRHKLYLSYQGADIKNNSERQPSLILSELMDYLARGYGWRFEPGDGASQLQMAPLHPFSPANFEGARPSFDGRWLALSRPGEARDNLIELPEPEVTRDEAGLESVTLESLVRFFENPPRAFAEERLGLNLSAEGDLLDDAEPFDADPLAAFQGRERLLAAQLDPQPARATAQAREILAVGGQLPDSRGCEAILDSWEAEARVLARALAEAGPVEKRSVELTLAGVRLSAELPLVATVEGPELLLSRPARVKAKDRLRLWLYHLLACATGVSQRSRGLFLATDKEGNPEVEQLELASQPAAEAHLVELLETWRAGRCRPLLLNAQLGFAVCAAQYKKSREGFVRRPDADAARARQWWTEWDDGPFANPYGTGRDAYVRWFWPEGAELAEWWDPIRAVYERPCAALSGVAGESATVTGQRGA
ncbi:exodeoxyribonuclease V subunit gamma [Motiliproteus sp. SC1-56]|uniref:exodeoxyribonuclease V subunit gamma n=1 Tax=Motiliproteus sp. SC1-56 TaxID=2799565 RepID=UPI001A8CBC1D|nr:exodeoxyribonuclease V subunit gamma [Motiliproteus sp. SC1-56]